MSSGQFSRLPYKYWGGYIGEKIIICKLIYNPFNHQRDKCSLKFVEGYEPIMSSTVIGKCYGDSIEEIKLELL